MNFQQLIDVSQSHIITINDINELYDMIALKNNLYKISNKENLIKQISQLLNDKNENEKLLKKIRNLSSKSDDLLDLFNKKLNKNLFAEQKFETFSKNGIFNIIYVQNKEYNIYKK